MKPLLYLEIRQFINSVKNTVRSPKRLIPALIVGAWLLSSLISNLLLFSGATPSGGFGGRAPNLRDIPIESIKAGTFLFLSLGSMLVIYQAFTSGMLIFSVAHIDFMFPTPISRRKVLLIRLLKDYLKYGFWVALLFVLIGSPVLGALNVPLFPGGFISIAALVALLLLVVNVAHTINIVFTFGFERLKQRSILIKGALILAFASALAAGIYQYVKTGDSFASLLWAADSPVIRVVFAPAKWCSALVMAPLLEWTAEEMLQLGALWLLAGVSFLVLLSRRENVYEPSIGISIKHAKRRQAMRSGDYTDVRIDAIRERGAKRRFSISVPPFGKGATAIFWKNMISKYRMSSTPLIVVMVLPLALLVVRHFVKEAAVLRMLPMMLVYMVYVLSIVAAAEIRAELRYANILKSMPIPAWKVMAVQAIYSAAYLGGGVAIFAGCMYVVLPQTRGELLLASAVCAPFIGFACVGAAMIPSLLYPDARDAAQNYIYNLVGFLLVSIALIPTIVLGIVLWWLLGVPQHAMLVAICAANLLVGAAGVSIAGSIFRRFDPTSE